MEIKGTKNGISINVSYAEIAKLAEMGKEILPHHLAITRLVSLATIEIAGPERWRPAIAPEVWEKCKAIFADLEKEMKAGVKIVSEDVEKALRKKKAK